jgi:hypothetical protein
MLRLATGSTARTIAPRDGDNISASEDGSTNVRLGHPSRRWPIMTTYSRGAHTRPSLSR